MGITPSEKLLLDSPPLVIQKELAVALSSLDKAIVLQQIHFLMRVAKENKNKYTRRDGRWWVYNSYGQWREDHFPFWSESKIGRIIRELEDDGLILADQLDAHKYDQRKWYTIDYGALDRLMNECTVDHTKMTPSDVPECDDRTAQPDTIMSKTTPETTTHTDNGRDFLGDVLDLDGELFGDNADRPKGWRAMDEAEYKVCTRVAEHWRKGILPMQAKFIEIQQVAAAELLSMFDGDVRKTIQMIDAYRQEYVEKKRDFTVSGPQGLLNEMPAFLDRRGRQGDPIQPAFEIIVVPVEETGSDNGNKGNGEAVGNVKPQDTGNGTRRPRGTFSTIRRTGP